MPVEDVLAEFVGGNSKTLMGHKHATGSVKSYFLLLHR